MDASEVTLAPQVAYTRDACSYDKRTASYQGYRRNTVDLLRLRPGDVVLDVGCGTGLCLGFLRDKVGSWGHVLGIDGSPHMIGRAAARVRSHRWHNVGLLQARVEEAPIGLTADAALFSATHDILQSQSALENVFRHLRPGAWVAASGGKWAAPWKSAVNFSVWAAHEPFVRSFDGFAQPWTLLERFVEDLSVVEVAFGGGYLAVGRVPTDSRVPHRPS